MEPLKRIARGSAFVILGIALWGLIAWEWSLGFVAGSYGGVWLREMPGTAWFILALQAAFASWLMFIGVKSFGRGSNAAPPVPNRSSAMDMPVIGFGILLSLLGLWAAGEIIANIVRLLRDSGGDLFSKALTGFFLFASIGVLGTLLFSFIIRPAHGRLKSYLRSRKA